MPNGAIVANALPIARAVHAFFAPVERTTTTPAEFDPAVHGKFALDAPPAPWIALGPIRNLRRTASTSVELVRRGAKGAAGAQFRRALGTRVEFEFVRWGKLQMALSGGAQHFNVLARDLAMEPVIPGGHIPPPVRVLAGSTATELLTAPGEASQFAPGDLVVVDEDYTGQTGYIGTGVAGAFVRDNAVYDEHFIRSVSFNVSRVAEATDNKLVLAQPLPGGYPLTGAGIAKVVAFEDREGGSLFSEWSALFVVDAESGGRVCYYYPRLQVAAPASESAVEIADAFIATTLHAAFNAHAVTDPRDSEEYVARRIYFPQELASVY